MMRILSGAGLATVLVTAACGSSKGDTGGDSGRVQGRGGGVSDSGSSGSGSSGSGGSASGGSTSGGSASGGLAARDAGSQPKGFKLTWSVSDARRDFALDGGVTDAAIASLPGLGGVRVCVHERPEIACVSSGDDGAFELDGLPPMTDLVLTFDKEGFVRESKTIQTASTDMNGAGSSIVMSPAQTKTPRGNALDPQKGGVDFFALASSAAPAGTFEILVDTSVSLSPAAGEGPDYYLGTRYEPGATRSRGGLGFFWNLDPGDYTLTITNDRYDCTAIATPFAGFGIPVGGAPNAVKFTILPGYLTEEMGVYCTERSVIVGTDGG